MSLEYLIGDLNESKIVDTGSESLTLIVLILDESYDEFNEFFLIFSGVVAMFI